MREQTSQACDACRTRKVRCQIDDTRSSLTLEGVVRTENSGNQSSATQQDAVPQQRCRRCHHLGITCSYLLPVKRRGPKGPRKKRLAVDTQTSLAQSTASPDSKSAPSAGFDVRFVPGFDPSSRVQDRSPSTSRHDAVHVTSPDDEASLESSIDGRSAQSISKLLRDHTSPSWPLSSGRYVTDHFLDRTMMHRIVEDYILHVYPAIPVFHVPTFRRQFELQRDRHDQQFFGLVMGIVAVAVGLLPRKFNDYRLQPSFARFATRQDVIECCYSRATQARDLRYFDEISHTKWATAYVFSLAFFHIGKFNMSRIVECEANLYARLLEIPRISAYSGLNCIETQLRKKAFWLMFYGYVHLQHADFRRERPGFIDCATLHEIDLESLMPVPHDDEHITESSYGSPDPNEPSLAASFNLRSQVFWCAVKELPIHGREAQKAVHCHCTRMNNPVEYENYLQARLKELKYVLDKAPWYLRQWMAQKSPDSSASKAIHTQYSQIEIIRVDIHVTHIWLQSVIMDHLEMYRAHRSEASPARPLTSPSVAMSADDAANAEWAQREDLCRQLLQVLYSASDLSLETLGVILVQKTRDVAVSLLNCPYGDSVDSVGPGARAKAYLADFSRKLEDLDKAEGGSSLSVQSWIDTDRARAGGGNYS